MREILESCVALDRTAFETYRGMSAVCAVRGDEDLATTFDRMAREERQHIDWWSDLLVAWESGLVPDIADEADLGARLTELITEVEGSVPEVFEALSSDDMLGLGAQIEFFMLDPVFGELTDLMRPGGRSEVSRAYSAHVMRLVEAIERRYEAGGLAVFLARVLKRAYRDQQRLARLAVRDQLTGLYNRRGLLGHVRQWLSWSARYDRPLAVALVDIDRFKQINDEHGHAIGDEALKVVAAALSEVVRGSDLVGRFGGDEFVVLAPETDDADLAVLLD
ncbi:MAG: diguanylate cyclase, partial [Actinobacteria bacterium]